MFLTKSLYALTVTMNANSAEAALQAIQNHALSRTEARKIAQMYGNQGAIRNLNEFKIAATAGSFANALYAAARGEKVH